MRATLIHNPESGDDDHGREQLVELLTRAGHRVEYFQSTGPWPGALDERPDIVVVAGGDGTVSEVARATAGRAIPVTILPMGTANNIAGSLGLNDIPPEELVAGWTHASFQPFDLGVALGPWGTYEFLESVGVGLLAGMIAEIDAGGSTYVNRLRDRESRIVAARRVLERVLRGSPAVKCDLRLDDRCLSGEYLLVEILNFGAAGPNLRLAPDGNSADGLLDVALVEAHERAWLEDHLSTIGTDPLKAPRLRIHHARRVTLKCEPCVVHLDDELRQPDGPEIVAEARVDSAALTFVVPPAAARRRALGTSTD